jgi:hypothetical protein
MKYEITKHEDGGVTLTLGTHKSVDFASGVPIDAVVTGVEMLIEAVVGVSVFELVTSVLKAQGVVNEDGTMKDG